MYRDERKGSFSSRNNSCSKVKETNSSWSNPGDLVHQNDVHDLRALQLMNCHRATASVIPALCHEYDVEFVPFFTMQPIDLHVLVQQDFERTIHHEKCAHRAPIVSKGAAAQAAAGAGTAVLSTKPPRCKSEIFSPTIKTRLLLKKIHLHVFPPPLVLFPHCLVQDTASQFK